MASVGGFTKAPITGPSKGPAPSKGPTPTGPPRPQQRSSKPVVVKSHTRAAPAARPSANRSNRGGASAAATSPLLNPNQPLSGQSLLNAAQQLSNVQTAGPLTELQKQIAANDAQTRGTINATGGFYNQLEPFVQQGVTQQGQIGSALNSQLQGIGNDTQSQLQGIGGNAMASLMKYAPGDNASAASSDLAAQIARQQGLAAQQAGTYRSFGANQGALNQSYGASQLGTFGLQGQEALKGIAQSGTVKNQPLMAKIAGIQASKGALTATNLGRLRQQEVSNGIARAGLGLKQTSINTTAANDAARIKTALRGQNITQRGQTLAHNDRVAAVAQQNLNSLRTTNTAAANNAANNSTRLLLASMRNNGKTGKVATGQQANAVFSHIDYVTGEIQNLIAHGIPPAQAYHIIQNGGRIQTGTSASGQATYRTYFPNRLGTQVLNAAYNVRSGGSGLTRGDLAWLASLGIKNPTRYGRAKAGTGMQHNAGPQSNGSAPSAGNLASAGV